jgi:hypothetical protein
MKTTTTLLLNTEEAELSADEVAILLGITSAPNDRAETDIRRYHGGAPQGGQWFYASGKEYPYPVLSMLQKEGSEISYR